MLDVVTPTWNAISAMDTLLKKPRLILIIFKDGWLIDPTHHDMMQGVGASNRA
jgi:hypothetical protein